MKEKEILKKLNGKSVFNIQEMQRILDSSKEYTKIVLNRLVKRGEIKRIKRNAYTIYSDPYIIATNLFYPSYLSFWSASNYKGHTEQILNTIQIATNKRQKNIVFQNYKIEFIKIKNLFGYEKIKTEMGSLFVAEDEKLIIDAVENQTKLGNFDEVKKVIENSKIDKIKLIRFLKRNSNQSTIKRVGYLIEKIKKIDLSKEFELDNNFVKLNKFSSTKKKNKKWRLLI
ncbi:MAG: hypothetical protein NUV46_01555 [Nanoarchaeota archaeon]|nr:hypothetical protein [Nanoarchaeota archaeon]